MGVDDTIKAVLFDFGNVICEFDNQKFLREIARHTDKTVPELDRIIYHASGFPRRYETGLMSSEEFYDDISVLCGLDITKDEFIRAYTDIFTPIPETCDLIRQLSPKYKLGLLSNTSEWDYQFGFRPADVMALFDTVTLSFEVGAMKPEEKIYRDALGKLGQLPQKCAYIDDIARYAEAATELGMHGIHYTKPDQLVRDLKELGVEMQ